MNEESDEKARASEVDQATRDDLLFEELLAKKQGSSKRERVLSAALYNAIVCRFLDKKKVPEQLRKQAAKKGKSMSIVMINDEAKLQEMVNGSPKTVVHEGMLTSILHDCHRKGGHIAARSMHQQLSVQYSGLPRSICELYCKCCYTCGLTRGNGQQLKLMTPIVTKGFGARGQIDLIDFSSNPAPTRNGVMKYFLHYSPIQVCKFPSCMWQCKISCWSGSA
eukprot:TRINITY_DN2549_c0_g1_i7.p1 TRINITY_DN2549_c0_g1~~TRINITY_DN2549_c0_g1_i7.p1  ORF type:complete len:258 (+),score=-10.17 TRINITY_DN2549_c0_g1_i7:111-776(+)